jgi:NitT/TauT family transport system substrate-binding protein
MLLARLARAILGEDNQVKPATTLRATFLGAAIAASVLLLAGGPARADDDVAFALNWIISGRNAGYFVALDKGFYKAAGINATITRGRGSGDTLKRVAIGESLFGLVDTATVILGRANDDVPVKMIGMMFGRSSTAVLYAKESGIKTPKDLEGRTVARSAAGSTINMWPAFLVVNKIDRSTIREITVTASSYVPMLLSRQVDAVLDQSSYVGRYQKAADEQKLTIAFFRYSDYGYDLYGDAIVATEATIRDKPDLAKRFLAATMRGNLYAFDHPDEAVEILARFAAEAEPDVAKAELLDTKALALNDEVKSHGYGYIDGPRLVGMVKMLQAPLGLKRELTADELYTPALLK